MTTLIQEVVIGTKSRGTKSSSLQRRNILKQEGHTDKNVRGLYVSRMPNRLGSFSISYSGHKYLKSFPDEVNFIYLNEYCILPLRFCLADKH